LSFYERNYFAEKQNLLLKYKLLSPMAKPPQKMELGSAGYDLTSAETHIIKSNSVAKIASDSMLRKNRKQVWTSIE
jgi:dUTPase